MFPGQKSLLYKKALRPYVTVVLVNLLFIPARRVLLGKRVSSVSFSAE